ncbi:ABC transporter substrate-binding protein [Microbacterium sp. CFBP9034]|uniref:ABC transporter substrate-binding protein n=1 Tax=Microbacterium sp. CFBP9034 TaxID=3096540 RepID=UPI002A6AF00A|nr:extracellular solute-binding protein [Microbacterium sp. CFBP9034]MDY0908831.1 extracellular solute-binding protein [Microbacterium sp. CFBP9034]
MRSSMSRLRGARRVCREVPPRGRRQASGHPPRRFGALVLGVSVIVAGCAAPAEETVVFWSFTGIQQAAQVERYLRAHPEARITLSEVGTSTETADALTAALAGGNAPDLVLIQEEDLPRFVAADGHFRDLREFGADELAADYLPWAWDAATTASGRVIGIPTDVGGMALAYRADLFAEAGLPTDPAEVAALWPTWEEFVRVGAEFAARSDAAFLDNISTTMFVNAVNQLPIKYYAADGELALDDNDELRTAFDAALDAHDAGISRGLAAFSAGWSAGMARGDFAVTAAPSWMLRVIESTAPETEGRWRITSVPGITGNWGGSYLAIPSRSRHPEKAWDYIAATQSPDAQSEHFAAGGPLPAAIAPYRDEEIAAYADDFFGPSAIGAVLTSSLLDRGAVPQGPATSTVNRAFLQALESVEQGSLDADEAWASLRAAVDAAVPAGGP